MSKTRESRSDPDKSRSFAGAYLRLGSYKDGFAAAHTEEPFTAATRKPPSPSPTILAHSGDTGDLIQFPLTKAVKPTPALLCRHTDPKRALAVLIESISRLVIPS